MRRILLSLGMVVFIGTVVYVGATGAFFSDTETSTGNVFAAGAIDLQIDNESYVTNGDGELVKSPETSWELDDLTGHLFFNFFDLKPGDIGEDTISIHVNNNDAWLCAAAQITADDDVSSTEPELEEGDEDEDGGNLFDGELGNELNFAFWADDGDNVFETSEVNSVFLAGPISNLGGTGQIALADSQGGPLGPGPVPGGQTVYIGKAWCFGTLEENPDGSGENTDPVTRETTGFICNGESVSNLSQTDLVRGDIQFYAEQFRNNESFLCSDNYNPEFPDEVLPIAGANNLLGYSAPTCNVTVDNDFTSPNGTTEFSTIQAAIDDADVADGSVVCVADGEYDEFAVDRPLTIAGITNPASGSANVTPSGTGVQQLALVTSSDVTITGLHFDGTGVALNGNQAAGVQVSPSGSDVNNVHIVYNVIENLNVDGSNTTASNKGIQWFTETASGFSLTNSSFSHNIIDNITSAAKGGYGIQTVGDMDDVSIDHNTISDIDGAWEAGIALDSKDLVTTSGVSVDLNHVMDGIATFSVQVEANVDGGGIVVNDNNLETLLYGGSSDTQSPDTLDAENNWWGNAAPAVGVDVFLAPGTNTVDFTPFKFGPFPTS